MKKIQDCIRTLVSGEAALQTAKLVSSFHRIQASPGYRSAANALIHRFEELGIFAELHSFEVDGKKHYLNARSFQEWTCRSAWLKIEGETDFLADFAACPNSIIQKSKACDFRKETIDLVFLDRGADKASYSDLDIRGKLIFYRGPFKEIQSWIVEKGALGIVTDCIYEQENIRTRYDLFDTRNYTSFWWQHDGLDAFCFGFVLTPRQGEELATRCREHLKLYQSGNTPSPFLRMNAYIDSKLYPGHIEAVEAFLPGETCEEILLIAHLCHPQPSANDNASGVAAATEAMRVLKNLSETGIYPPLQRGIRLLFIPEFSGTYAWLHNNPEKVQRAIAGLNLDMVGGRMGKGRGPLCLSSLPLSAASIATAVAEISAFDLAVDYSSEAGTERISAIPLVFRGYEAGSDHSLLSSPDLSIPSPMLGQWPDLYYHTSSDTISELDQDVLARSSQLAALYAYRMANFGMEDWKRTLLHLKSSHWKNLSHFQDLVLCGNSSGKLNLVEVAEFSEEYVSRQAEDGFRHLSLENQKKAAMDLKVFEKEITSLSRLVIGDLPPKMTEPQGLADSETSFLRNIYYRNYPCILTSTDGLREGSPQRQKRIAEYYSSKRSLSPNPFRTELLIQYQLNGCDPLKTVAKKVRWQEGDPFWDIEEFVKSYVDLLSCFELIKLKRES